MELVLQLKMKLVRQLKMKLVLEDEVGNSIGDGVGTSVGNFLDDQVGILVGILSVGDDNDDRVEDGVNSSMEDTIARQLKTTFLI